MSPRFNISESSAPVPAPPFQTCWAKTDTEGRPGPSVLDHCTIVGAVAHALAAHAAPPVRTLLGRNPSIVAALHDVGKVSPGFQLKCPEAVRQTCPELLEQRHRGFVEQHALVSEAAVNQRMGEGAVSRIVGRHHGFSPRAWGWSS